MYVGETINKCEFYSIRADLLDPKAEQLEFGFPTVSFYFFFSSIKGLL